MYLRKESAGSASTGHEWPEDGSIVEVPDHVGGVLLDHSREFADVTEEHLSWLAAQELGRRKVTPPEEMRPRAGLDAFGSAVASSADNSEEQDTVGSGSSAGAVQFEPELAGEAEQSAEDTAGQNDTETPAAKRPYRRRTSVAERAP